MFARYNRLKGGGRGLGLVAFFFINRRLFVLPPLSSYRELCGCAGCRATTSRWGGDNCRLRRLMLEGWSLWSPEAIHVDAVVERTGGLSRRDFVVRVARGQWHRAIERALGADMLIIWAYGRHFMHSLGACSMEECGSRNRKLPGNSAQLRPGSSGSRGGAIIKVPKPFCHNLNHLLGLDNWSAIRQKKIFYKK